MIVGIERAKETFPQNYTTSRSLDASHMARRLCGFILILTNSLKPQETRRFISSIFHSPVFNIQQAFLSSKVVKLQLCPESPSTDLTLYKEKKWEKSNYQS